MTALLPQPHGFEGFGAGAKGATPYEQATSVARNPRDLLLKGDTALEPTPKPAECNHGVAQVPTLVDARLELIQIAFPGWPTSGGHPRGHGSLTSLGLSGERVPLAVGVGGLQIRVEVTASHDLNVNGAVCGKPFQKDRYFPLRNLRDDQTGGP